jgi:serine protease AprX
MGVLVVSAVLVAVPTSATAGGHSAEGIHGDRSGGPAVAASPDRGPGKGDADGDKISDDLEAAIAATPARERVAVIVQGSSPSAARRAAPSLRVADRFSLIEGFSGSMLPRQVAALARIPFVTFVELNGQTHLMDAAGERDYGVQAAQSASPSLDADGSLDGSGVGICIVDTGIDPGHEQVSDRIDGWVDLVNAQPLPYDDNGHGTHVAGIAAGDGTGANAATAANFGGVAPAARIYAAKVLDDFGQGSDSDVVLGIEWCADHAGVRVISMSLGSPGGDGSDAASVASAAAVSDGKVVVAAAGNDGDAEVSIAAPGVSSSVITVGAGSDYSAPVGLRGHDDGLYLAGFSSRGPTTDDRIKPDVVAPGVSVVSAEAGTTSGYVSYSGTSMATPFVAGVVALGVDAAPNATPAQVKQALHVSAFDAGAAGPDNDWGWGLVDARGFIDELKATSPLTHAAFPDHELITSSVADDGVRNIALEVTTAGQPLAVTLLIDGTARCVIDLGPFGCLQYEFSPDLDAYLLNPAGQQVAMSRCPLEASNDNCSPVGRSETLGVSSASAGTWTLRVVPDSGSPNNGKGGDFTADVFGAMQGTPVPNALPIARDDVASTAMGSAVSVPVLANDSDADGDALTVTSVGSASNGATSKTATKVTYAPDAGFTGVDSFTYTISDGRGGSATGSVSVSVGLANTTPSVSIIDPDGVDDGATAFVVAPGKRRVQVSLSALPAPNPAEPGDTYTYQWKRGKQVLSSTSATMTDPRRPGRYTYRVRLSDGRGNTVSDSIVVTVTR